MGCDVPRLCRISLRALMQRRAGNGPPGFLPVAFFIAFPLMGRSASRADDADRVLGLLDEDNEQNPSLSRTDRRESRAEGPLHLPASRRADLRTQKRPPRMKPRVSSGSTRPSLGPT